MPSRKWMLAVLVTAGTWLPTAGAAELAVSAPLALSDAGRRVDALELTLDGEGRAHLVWVDKGPAGGAAAAGGPPGHAGHGDRHHARDDLFYTRGTRTLVFDEPRRINPVDGEVWGFAISRPRIQVSPAGSVHVLYPANTSREGRAPEVVAQYLRSDDGARWDPPRTLNTPAGTDHSEQIHGGFSAVHVFGTLGVAPDGAVHAFWIDTRGLDANEAPEGASEAAMTPASVWGAVSRDDGRSFTPDRPIIEKDVCPCCQLTTAFADDGGTVFLGLRQVTPESYRDSVIATSRDGGAQFAAPVRLNEVRWRIEGCPMKPTAMAVDGAQVYSAWYSAVESPPGVYLTRSEDGGESFSAPLAMHPEASLSDAPALALAAGRVYAAWHARVDGPRAVFLSVSSDGGRHWSAPQRISAPDGGAAGFPVVAGEADGSALVAWLQDGRAWIARAAPGETSAAAR